MKILALLVPVFVLSACGGGSGGSPAPVVTTPVVTPPVVTPAPVQEAFTLIDPNEAAGNKFGQKVVELSNGNIAVQSRNLPNGAIHIYNPLTQTLIKTISGGAAEDLTYGDVDLTPLANGNLVIAASGYDVGGLSDAGAVLLIDGATGDQIGLTISGDDAGDELGNIATTVLSNGFFTISSHNDTVSGMSQAGSVILVNGATGAVVVTINGDNAGDKIGNGSVTELNNGNVVIAAYNDIVSGNTGAGSVRLINGTTGAQIGIAITGDNGLDFIGYGGVFALDNGNYVIASSLDDIGGVANAGSVMLVNGTTGVQIGATITGDNIYDNISSDGIILLSNNEFAVVSKIDADIGGVADAGSVMFFNGSTGAQLGSTIMGDAVDDRLGKGGVIQLSNGNIVISSPDADTGGSNSGSVKLVNSTTKAVITTLAGDAGDQLSLSGIKALADGNFVVVTHLDGAPGINYAGSVSIMNGTTGATIAQIYGDDANDWLGRTGITVLENGNIVVSSGYDDVNGVSNVGSVMLLNSTTGAQIGSTMKGSTDHDNFGSNNGGTNGVVALKGSNNYVIASSAVDVNGVVNAGSVILVDGNTGIQIGTATTGNDTDDELGHIGSNVHTGIIALANGNYLIASEENDDNGNVDTGSVLYRLGQ